jgi:hypothetical protein
MFRVLLTAVTILMLCASAGAMKDADITITPVRGATPVAVTMGDRAPGDQCDAGILDAVYTFGDWLISPEEYAVFADPQTCDPCPGGWEPVSVSFYLNLLEEDTPCTTHVSAGIRQADMDYPGCYIPGDVICWSSVYEVVLPFPGLFIVTLPLDAGCEMVDGPFFSCFRTEDEAVPGNYPDIVIDDVPAACISYDDYGFGFEDLYTGYEFPGSVSMFTTLECQEVGAYLDIKPGSCPNPFNTKAHGRLPVAVLGTEAFDVTQIDVTTLALEGPDGAAYPIWNRLGDVATPFEGELCDCHELGADGFTDLKLQFMRPDVTAILGSVDDGDMIQLTLTGDLVDGTEFEASDCIWVLKKGKQLEDAGAAALDAPDTREATAHTTWGTIKALYR